MQLIKDVMSPYSCDTVTLYCDNQTAISLARNAIVHRKSKHMDVKYHFVKAITSSDRVDLIYVPTDKNIANIFTKPVGGYRQSPEKVSAFLWL